jgi:alpha-L-fucosidase
MSDQKTPDHMKWFVEARFGMFIHWGLYAIPGRGEWIMYQDHIPNDEYAKLADEFNPQHYKPRDWVALAQDAGMKYMVLTTRHHDGFCLFDSKVSDFTSSKTAAKRDLVAEYAEACHALGMPMGLYYSLVDWRLPGALNCYPYDPEADYSALVDQAHAQVRELMTNYGKVAILWYDGGGPGPIYKPVELNAMARKLQPGIIINNRSGTEEDYGTPEQHVVAEERPWEACMTMNDSWGYVPSEKNYKTVMQLLGTLSMCAGQGGNLLLNVGPDSQGRIPSVAVDELRSIGKWMRVNGKAIYGSSSTTLKLSGGLGCSTRVGEKLYLMIHAWPGSTIAFGWCGNPVLRARVVSTGDEARIEQKGDRVWLRDLPQYAPDPDMSVVEIEVEGEPRWPSLRYV